MHLSLISQERLDFHYRPAFVFHYWPQNVCCICVLPDLQAATWDNIFPWIMARHQYRRLPKDSRCLWKERKKDIEMLACKLWCVDAATARPVKSQLSVCASTQSQSECRCSPGSPAQALAVGSSKLWHPTSVAGNFWSGLVAECVWWMSPPPPGSATSCSAAFPTFLGGNGSYDLLLRQAVSKRHRADKGQEWDAGATKKKKKKSIGLYVPTLPEAQTWLRCKSCQWRKTLDWPTDSRRIQQAV